MDKKSLKILLIEDSATDAFTIKEALSRYAPNTECIHKDTFEAGKEIMESENIDFVFLDLGLPDTAGPEDTYEQIKRWVHKLPIVVLTNLEDHDLAKVMVHDGFADFLHKDMIVRYPQRVEEAIDFAIERHALRKQILQEKEKLAEETKKKDSILNCFMGGYSIDSEDN